jgi:hypothetical protein
MDSGQPISADEPGRQRARCEPAGGTLTVETATCRPARRQVDCAAGPHVLLAVTDSENCGMTPG